MINALSNKFNVLILKIVSYLIFFGLLFQFVNGLWPNISIFLFNGMVILPNIVFKFIISFAVMVSFLISRRIIADKSILIPYILFIVYLFFEVFYFKFYYGFSLKYILFGFNSYFFYIFLIPFLASVYKINEKTVIKIFFFLAIPIIILALLQHFYNSVILPVKSVDDYYNVLVWNFYNNVRATSFFGSSISLAFYSILIVLFALNFFIYHRNYMYRVFLFLAIILLLFVVFITYSRTGYLLAFFSLCTFILLSLKKINFIIKNLPIIYFILGSFLIAVLICKNLNRLNDSFFMAYNLEYNNISLGLSDNALSKNIEFKNYDNKFDKKFKFFKIEKAQNNITPPKINSSDSFVMRMIEWRAFSKILFSDIKILLFGRGIYYTPHTNNKYIGNFATDNLYIDLLLNLGITGFILIFWFLWKLWIYVINNYDSSFTGKVVISILSSFTITNFTANIIFVYMNILLFLFLIKNKEYDNL